ncbi:farnesol dehydrogenase-like [Coccinella septempunctata]|uniref:farnesol dehydrogenase-like n=1 Tax=Coccinella septempunctata TaxID=41139 RepID=UPI001D077E92|nr:farnesol dehydrogenase-like [Coccinella septempunctata]XP_044744167.1 farnesol dehydrogenase-like [Coccinella septempunctata]
MVLSMERRRGKVAVVTGASAGIGAKIIEMMVKNGMIVIGIARRSELVEKHAEKLANQPGKLHAMKVDMTDDGAIVKAFEEIERKFDPIHVLVNNAGIFPTGSLLNGTTEFWRKVIDTNVLALCTATREAIRIMKKNGVDGDIININSIAGHKVPLLPFLNIYPASKFAVTAICESLRQELVEEGSKIRVTSISPGAVGTEGFEVMKNDVEKMESIPSLDPEDVADSIEYVLSTPPHVQVYELTIKPVGEKF